MKRLKRIIQVRENSISGYVVSIKEGEKEALVHNDYIVSKMFQGKKANELTDEELKTYSFDYAMRFSGEMRNVTLAEIENDKIIKEIEE